MGARVAGARAIQTQRYAAAGLPNVTTNAAAPADVVERFVRPEGAALALLREAAERMRLTARGYHRVLKLARTLADLDAAEKVGRVHLAEALSYRAVTDRVAQAA